MKTTKILLTILLIFSIVCYSFQVCGICMAKLKIKNENYKCMNESVRNTMVKQSENKDNYIISGKNRKAYEKMLNNYNKADTLNKRNNNLMAENNIAIITMTREEANELRKDDGVNYIEKDAEVHGDSRIKNRNINKCKQKELEDLWNMKMVKVRHDRKKTDVNNRVKVAVIDSGVDMYDDIDVADYIDLIPGYENVLPIYYDVSGHGTSVAGIIAAQNNGVGITGVNPNVELYSVRVLDEDNKAPVSRIIEGIYWAKNKGVDIINMSFGTSVNSQALYSAIKEAADAGILLIASAGNTGDKVEYPAAYSEVVAVGSVNSEGIIDTDSAKGEEVELVAPGEKVATTGSFLGTMICSGTSMAAPHVTGIASLLWEEDRTVSADFIRELLNSSANGYKSDDAYGNGLVDYEYAKHIYKKFKKKYKRGEVYANNNFSEINTIEDNIYVEGRWGKTEHQQLLDSSIIISAADIKTMKQGAIYPDNSLKMRGLSAHPGFHGGNNYVANSIYLSCMARDGKIVPASDYFTQNEIKICGEKTFEDIYGRLKECSSDINNNYFLWGIVIHNIADSYAHRTKIKKNSQDGWITLVHDGNANIGKPGYLLGADNPYIARGRWDSAQTAINLTLYEISKNGGVSYNVFQHESYFNTYPDMTLQGYPYYDAQFKMINLYSYASDIDYGARSATILKEATYGSFK